MLSQFVFVLRMGHVYHPQKQRSIPKCAVMRVPGQKFGIIDHPQEQRVDSKNDCDTGLRTVHHRQEDAHKDGQLHNTS